MRRYLLFAWSRYHAKGGWRDVLGSFDSEHDAEAAFDALIAVERPYPELSRIHADMAHAHVIDTTTGTVTREWGGYDGLDRLQDYWH